MELIVPAYRRQARASAFGLARLVDDRDNLRVPGACVRVAAAAQLHSRMIGLARLVDARDTRVGLSTLEASSIGYDRTCSVG